MIYSQSSLTAFFDRRLTLLRIPHTSFRGFCYISIADNTPCLPPCLKFCTTVVFNFSSTAFISSSRNSNICWLCTCIWNLNNKWIIRTLTWGGGGGGLVIFEALFKAFPVFSVLETCRVYLLTIDLGIVKCIKICRHGPNYVQELAVTKVAECRLIKFF